MIRAEVSAALAILDAGKSYPQKLAYALAKGRIQLKRITREIEAARADAYSPEVLEYIRGREALGIDHAAKDEAGNPIPQGNGFKLADPAAYRAALIALDDAYAGARIALEAQDRAFRDYMNSEVTITPHAVDSLLVPEGLSIEEAEIFMALLAWEDGRRILEVLATLPSANPDGSIVISPAWAGTILSAGAVLVSVALGISKLIFPSHKDLQAARDECRERHEESRASVDALDKMLRAEFAGQIEASNRNVLAEFRVLAGKVERLLIRTAVLQDRSSHSDDDETRFPA